MKNKKSLIEIKNYQFKQTMSQKVLWIVFLSVGILAVLAIIILPTIARFYVAYESCKPVIKTLEIENLELHFGNDTIILHNFQMDYDKTKIESLFANFVVSEGSSSSSSIPDLSKLPGYLPGMG